MNFWKVLLFLPLFGAVGCDLLDRDETIPAFLRVDSVELLGGVSGSDFCFDNKVYNVEVYIGGENIGIYAFTNKALIKYVSLKRSKLEIDRKLEQMRALENNMKIDVGYINSCPLSIDTEEDLYNIKKLMEN